MGKATLMTKTHSETSSVVNHLVRFAEAFIVPARVDRYATLARTERGRKKWRSEVDHFQGKLRLELSEHIPSRNRNIRDVLALLRIESMAVDVAFAFSSNRRLLEYLGETRSIVEDMIRTDIGAIISFVPGRLAIYWGEEPQEKYIFRASA
jgi:hypothetical protein